MSRKRGRTSRPYRLRVRTVRRDPIDYDALARAALEQAAMSQQHDDEVPTPPQPRTKHQKGPDHDRLA